jgi:spoIIIJ-associated protein
MPSRPIDRGSLGSSSFDPLSDSDPDDLETSSSEEKDSAPGEEEVADLEFAEALGATVDQAIQNAIEILGAQEDEVEIQVLEEGTRPFLGIGRAKPYRVRVSWREDLDEEVFEEEIPAGESSQRPTQQGDAIGIAAAMPEARSTIRATGSDPLSPRESRTYLVPGEDDLVVDRARNLASDLLSRMGFDAEVTAELRENEIFLRIACEEDDALLIGRRGETRAALQHVLQRLLFPRGQAGPQIFVDINDYWERRIQLLRDEALELADKAIEQGIEQRTQPLPPEERRVVHRALADREGIRTESDGEGVLKRVCIRPY